jgi:hypothetical protein
MAPRRRELCDPLRAHADGSAFSIGGFVPHRIADKAQLPSYDQDEKTRAELAGNRSDAAKARLRDLDARQKTDRNRISLLALINGYGLPTVRTWADFGIVTLPPEVVAAFVAVNGGKYMRWGGEYQHSKDIMHLEVLATGAFSDVRRPPPDGLQDLVRAVPRPEPELPTASGALTDPHLVAVLTRAGAIGAGRSGAEVGRRR